MVDVGAKPAVRRRAVARASVMMAEATAQRLRELPKGDALVTAQLTTENFLLPEWMHVDLAIGHPILVIVLVWFLRDLYLRLKHDVPLDVETEDVVLARAGPRPAAYQA